MSCGFFIVFVIICHIVFIILSLQGSSLHVNIFYEESPHCVEYGQNHDTYIGEDGKPHVCDSQCPQKQAEEFDADGKPCVLVDDGKAFPGNFNGLCNF